jgi:hypothetical protein
LSRNDRAVMEARSRPQGGGVEVGCLATEAQWIAGIA